MKQTTLFTGCLCALGCEILYGLSYLFTKQATEVASTFALLGWRFLLAAILMSLLVACGVLKINLSGKSIRPLLLVALCNPCLYFIAETIGIRHTTASESGVFLACIPVASLVASTALLHKKPTKRQVAGILVTLAGVLVTVLTLEVSSSLSVVGYGVLLLAVLSYALYCVFVERASAFTGTEITYLMLLVGGTLFLLLAIVEASLHGTIQELLFLPLREPAFLAAILYQGIGCSILAFFLSNVAIAQIGVNRTSSFIGVATVVSILAGATLLHEPFTTSQLIGAVIIILGVSIANTR